LINLTLFRFKLGAKASEQPGERPAECLASVRFRSKSGSLRGVGLDFRACGATVTGGQLQCSCGDPGSRSVDFPTPSSALDRCRSGPRGLPMIAGFSRRTGRADPHDLGLPFKALVRCWNPSRSGEPDPDSSSRGLARFRPSTDSPATSTPGAPKRSFGPAVPCASSRSALVVSHHLDGFLRDRAAGLLRPAAGLGFVAFRAFAAHHRSEPKLGAPWNRRAPSPRRGSDPSKGSLANSRSASLRPLPSCRCRAIAGVTPSPTTVASGRRQRRSDETADSRALLR
jgi:hypothetical protein